MGTAILSEAYKLWKEAQISLAAELPAMRDVADSLLPLIAKVWLSTISAKLKGVVRSSAVLLLNAFGVPDGKSVTGLCRVSYRKTLPTLQRLVQMHAPIAAPTRIAWRGTGSSTATAFAAAPRRTVFLTCRLKRFRPTTFPGA